MAEALAKAELATWGVCYHAQQSLEKGLKALLVTLGFSPAVLHGNWLHGVTESMPPRLALRIESILSGPVFW